MRAAFFRTLTEMTERDERIVLLTGDLGFMAIEPFATQFPDRFVNVGVAEQNMIGLATGLAEAGFLPFVYSIATFAALRPYEFIRNGPILHQLPVRIVGMGGGFEYGSAGSTHHGLEDIGVMRIQPGITVIAPADPAQTRSALLTTWHTPGPIYFRLGKDVRGNVPGLDGRFQLGRAEVVRTGDDVLIISMGAIGSQAVGAAQFLEATGISAQVLVVSSLQPPPSDDLRAALGRFGTVLTVEAHYRTGGLGSLVCEIAARAGLRSRVIPCAVQRPPDGLSGSSDYLLAMAGLSSSALAEVATRALRRAG